MNDGYKQPTWAEQVESRIPARYKKAVYEDVPEDIRAAFESMRETRKGIFLHGEVGTGKTHIAYALFKNAPKAALKIMFVNTVELFKDMRDEISRDSYSKQRPTERVMEYEGVVIFDDVGVEKATDFVVEQLYLIVNTRYNKMLPMIFTSNYDLDGLADRLGDRIPSRINEMCESFPLNGKDRRLKSG